MKQKCTKPVKHLAVSAFKKAAITFWLFCIVASLTAQVIKPEDKMSPGFRLLVSNAARSKASTHLLLIPW